MSNVLIGIIGVILFIGLALAGALILGDDFKSTSNASQAASIMSMLKQSADAANMARLKTGQPVLAADISVLVPRFLKSVPINTTSAARATPNNQRYFIHLSDRVWPDITTRPGEASVVVGVVGSDDQARSVCQSIVETYGGSTIQTITIGTVPEGEAGCVLTSTFYTAFQKI